MSSLLICASVLWNANFAIPEAVWYVLSKVDEMNYSKHMSRWGSLRFCLNFLRFECVEYWYKVEFWKLRMWSPKWRFYYHQNSDKKIKNNTYVNYYLFVPGSFIILAMASWGGKTRVHKKLFGMCIFEMSPGILTYCFISFPI